MALVVHGVYPGFVGKCVGSRRGTNEGNYRREERGESREYSRWLERKKELLRKEQLMEGTSHAAQLPGTYHLVTSK